MDKHSLELLGFEKVRELVAGYSACSLGKEKAAALAPFADAKSLRLALQRVREMMDALNLGISPPLGGLRDIRASLKRTAIGVLLEIEQLLEIRDFLDLTGRICDFTARIEDNHPQLAELLSAVSDYRPSARQIDRAVDERGRVRDDATPDLARIRGELAEYDERIQAELRKMLRDPEIRTALRYPQPTVVGTHHVLAVAVNYRHKVIGVIHRTSSTGETLYIEPSRVARISAESEVLRSAEQREIRKVLRKFTTMIGQDSQRLIQILDILAEIDFITAKARYANDFNFHIPLISEDRRLRLVEARHPILLSLFRKDNSNRRVDKSHGTEDPAAQAAITGEDDSRSVVPITVHLGETFDLLIVTGPNTGGKTVALKTVGLVSLMGLSGLAIPALPNSQIPMFKEIMADIGDEQSIEQSLSTFSAHVSRISEILKHGSADALILLDELGAGTDPSEGAALGRAILDELLAKQCRAIVTTHLGDLKTFALSQPRAENGAVEFDVQTLRPTYHLSIGRFGQSCALKIAKRLGLERDILQRAHQYLRSRRHRHSTEMAKLQDLREQAEGARREADEARLQAVQIADQLRKKSDQMQQEAQVSAEIEKARATIRPGDQVRVPKFDKSGLVNRVDPRRRIAAVTVGAVQWELSLDELIPILTPK